MLVYPQGWGGAFYVRCLGLPSFSGSMWRHQRRDAARHVEHDVVSLAVELEHVADLDHPKLCCSR